MIFNKQRILSRIPFSRNILRYNSTTITLYQYATCPFCNRVKSYFDYSGIDYKTIEVNPLSKDQIKFSGSKSVPVATIGENVLTDSKTIIQYVRDSKDLITGAEGQTVEWTDDTDQWMDWTEKKLSTVLYCNITRSFGESFKSFQYVDNVDSWSLPQKLLNRYVSPVAMFAVHTKVKKKYGIGNEREELRQLLNEWVQAVGANTYLHGDRVTVPDLLVFGVLRGINELPTFEYAMKEVNGLQKWYQAVEAEVSSRKRA
eukprot:CAMPEP_0185032184 /NCGR_PEP_ID=MMETSP1103-20130426/20092_1 /TAXON_ID=36769 /ORGANISM="Paraphysomonas bandaiensis, Strain Caron Lab Isolate" /LENGTH=257 /DNA_ID=CAMNT_0027567983 /DNA_START=46 /DNA_END=819 /DNA_ORIENTATION=+